MAGATPTASGPPDATAEELAWRPEDPAFWDGVGKRIAMRNLIVSVPCLLCAFAVWLYWSILTVQMQELGFPFTKAQLYTLTAIAGLAGATLRIPNSFYISLSGGRNVIAATTGLLLLPAIFTGLALKDIQTPFATFAVLAALSGFGGGNFASSMSNISFFFPKRAQGLALGVNAGLGNLGVSLMQVLLPLAMTVGIFGALGGDPLRLPGAAGPEAGRPIWIQNAALVWVPVVAALTILAWLLMTNLPQHRVGSAPAAVARVLWLELLGLGASGIGLCLLLGVRANMWLVLPVTVVLTLLFVRYLSPGGVRESLTRQFAIFREKHTWVMTWLYTMTFGSFIGYSAAFPKLIQDVFGTLPDGSLNPQAPNPMAYAWLGPLVGSLSRPFGGWVSDRLGGARVTHYDTVLMIGSAVGVAYYVKAAQGAAHPEVHYVPFLLLFLVLFVTTGIGNGSTFRMVPVIFQPEMAGPVLGWTSAVAAYGAFIIPRVFGDQIQARHPEYALCGFAVYYVTCLAVNWWFYARKNAEVPC